MTTHEKIDLIASTQLDHEKLKEIAREKKNILREGADPINKNLQKRYETVIPRSETKDTINYIKSNRLIEYFEKHGSFDGAFDLSVRSQVPTQKTSQTLGMLSSETGTPWENTLNTAVNYSPLMGVLLLGVGLWWLKTDERYKQLYEGVVGEEGLYQKFLEKIGKAKAKVSESSLFLHNKALKEARTFAIAASKIDHEKFGKEDFLLFVKIQFCLSNQIDEYAGLQESIDLLQAALQAQQSYTTIHQIELSSQGSKQQEFYQYVYTLLKQSHDYSNFSQKVHYKLTEILPQIKTNEGKTTLESYCKAINELAESPFALELFVKFKDYHLDDFAALRTVAELISSLKGSDVASLKTLTYLVMAHYDNFEAIGQIIGITGKRSSPDTYARMFQYIALIHQYQASFYKFQQLVQVLKQWYKPYNVIVDIREEYPAEHYRQPQDFQYDIPGLAVYLKYKNYLTDQKTGYTYIDFGETVEETTHSTTRSLLSKNYIQAPV